MQRCCGMRVKNILSSLSVVIISLWFSNASSASCQYELERIENQLILAPENQDWISAYKAVLEYCSDLKSHGVQMVQAGEKSKLQGHSLMELSLSQQSNPNLYSDISEVTVKTPGGTLYIPVNNIQTPSVFLNANLSGQYYNQDYTFNYWLNRKHSMQKDVFSYTNAGIAVNKVLTESQAINFYTGWSDYEQNSSTYLGVEHVSQWSREYLASFGLAKIANRLQEYDAISISAGIQYAPSAQSLIGLQFRQDEPLSLFDYPGGGFKQFGLNWQWQAEQKALFGLLFSGHLALKYTFDNGVYNADLFNNVVRESTYARIGGRVMGESIKNLGLTPYIEVDLAVQNANIELFSWQNTKVTVGILQQL